MGGVLRYAVSNGFRRKGITFIAILGSGLGAALMTALMSLSGGMDREVTDALNQVAGVLTVSADDAPMVGGLLGGGSPLDLGLGSRIAALDHVESVQPAAVAMIPPEALTTLSPIGTPIRGVDPGLDARLDGPTVHILEGRSFSTSDEVIVGRRLAVPSPTSDTEPVEVGQEIEAPIVGSAGGATAAPGTSGAAAPVPGTMPEFPTRTLTVVGIFETGSDLEDFNIVGDLTAVQELAGLEADQVSSFTVRADSAENVEDVAARAEALFAEAGGGVRVTIAKDILGQVNQTLDIVRGFLTVVSVVAAVAGGMSIFVIMLMSVTERTREFGILKAAGWSNGNLLVAVIVESVLLALIGAVIGLGIGYGVGLWVNAWLSEDLTVLTPNLIGGIVAFGVAMGVLGGMYPVLRAARISPIRSLRAT